MEQHAAKSANRLKKNNESTFITGVTAVCCVLLLLLPACASQKTAYNPSKKFSPAQLQEDATVLWKTFQQCHPGLYWYNNADTVNNAFNNLPAAITDSLTEGQFRNLLAQKVALINCGHTSIRASRAAMKYRDSTRKAFFPLQVKTWGGDNAVILANAFRGDSVLVRGTSIQKINSMPISKIIDSMCRFISADGWHNSFRYQLISNNFSAWYKAIFGLSSSYTIEATTIAGVKRTVETKNFDPQAEDSLHKVYQVRVAAPVTANKQSRREALRKLTIDSAKSLAIMELNTFSRAGLPHFFKQTFKTLRKQHLKHLVIELRENGGGNIMNSTRLARYISNHAFKVADTVAAVSFNYPYPRAVANGLIYKIQGWFVTSKRSDGRLHYRMYERKQFKPYEKNHFSGNVFVITGGFTFSASTLFLNPLAGQKNVTIIGEETGGSAYGNNAVNVPDLKLPNTGIRVRLPLYRLVVSNSLPKNGRGIIPDVLVPPTSWHLSKRVDPKMLKVYELIGKQKN